MITRMKSLFNDKVFFRTLLAIALPVTIQNLIASSLNMIDIFMIGQVGVKEIAAVGLANQVFLLILMAIIGISSGSSIFIAQFWGKKDIENIRKMLGISLVGVSVVSLAFTFIIIKNPLPVMRFFTDDIEVIHLGADYLSVVCVSYVFTAITFAYSASLRSIGKTTVPMLVSILAVIINCICNFIFIFGKFGAPALGVVGAALGTTIARICETLILVGIIYLKDSVLAAKLSEIFTIPKELVYKVIKPIIFILLNEMCWGLGVVVYASAYGHISADASAAVQIANTVTNLSTVIIFGMSSAAATMVGNKIGEGKEEEGRLYAKRIAIISGFCGILISLVLALSANAVVSLFQVTPEVSSSAKIILYITSAVVILRTFNLTMIIGIQRGGGDAKAGLLIEAGTMWLVGVPMAVLGSFIFKFPVEVVVALVALEEVAKFILAFYRFKSGKWVNNIIDDISTNDVGVNNI